jgi:hypothetical protein
LDYITLSKTVGDMLVVNFDIFVEMSFLICFNQSYSMLNISETDCVNCLPNHRYHQCVDYEGLQTNDYHSFQISFNYSPCSQQYHLTLFKHHLTIADSGTLVLATYSGESYRSVKNVELHVHRHHYNYGYVALIMAVVIFLLAVLYLVHQKIKKLSARRGSLFHGKLSGKCFLQASYVCVYTVIGQ